MTSLGSWQNFSSVVVACSRVITTATSNHTSVPIASIVGITCIISNFTFASSPISIIHTDFFTCGITRVISDRSISAISIPNTISVPTVTASVSYDRSSSTITHDGTWLKFTIIAAICSNHCLILANHRTCFLSSLTTCWINFFNLTIRRALCMRNVKIERNWKSRLDEAWTISWELYQNVSYNIIYLPLFIRYHYHFRFFVVFFC